MWIEGNYRRIFLDLHIDDWNDEFLSKLDPDEIVSTVKQTGAQNLVVKGKPHTGLCYWPSSTGRMHRGLKGRDYVGDMIRLCHKNGIAVMVYFSQIFDNWAYQNHPAWRCVYVDGLSSKERAHPLFRKGRYGVVCPNNVEYRDYVKTNLQELTGNYDFEGMFLDMPFWPEVCYCPSCKERYFKETGREMPKTVDWRDPAWQEFQSARERWLGEYASFATRCIKEIKPDVTVEHNFATALHPWQFANTDLVMDACDYAGGDYFGGYLQQTFACKYYKNISPNLPFVYITSRCDPDLVHHTTTKTKEELLQHAITALVHNGAFSIVDGMNPDGTISPEIYHDVIGKVFEESRKFERFVSGDLLSNVAVWFTTHSKFDMADNGRPVSEQRFDSQGFSASKVRMASILRENHVPFDVIATKNLENFGDDVLVISDVFTIRDDEMEAIERYVVSGGNLYISGHLGHPRLYELLEVRDIGMTEHDFTYMSPTEKGMSLFGRFSRQSPLTVNDRQHVIEPVGRCDILATITLPYTLPDTEQFAAIHSNPPGVHTDIPSIIMKQVGKGRVMWIAAPIEKSEPYMSRQVVRNLVGSMCGEMKFSSNAPAHVEVIGWKKDGKLYFSAINQQESAPISPVYDVTIEIPGKIDSARIVDRDEDVEMEYDDGRTRMKLPRVDIFLIVEVG